MPVLWKSVMGLVRTFCQMLLGFSGKGRRRFGPGRQSTDSLLSALSNDAQGLEEAHDADFMNTF
jgi:hypothetical protein